MYTPWGPSQQVTPVIDGIVAVSTAGHGGLKLDAARQRAMPSHLRVAGGWYEEDCEWCIPFVAFAEEIVRDGSRYAVDIIYKGEHEATLRHWYPEKWEIQYGRELGPGESNQKDRRLFLAAHANDYLVTCAFGDWHENVPKGFVGGYAKLGGHDGHGSGRWFLVTEAEYQSRTLGEFVIDPARHREIERIA